MELLTLEQVAEELGIKPAGVKRLMWRRRLASPNYPDHSARIETIMMAHKIYVERKELDRYKAWKSGETSFTLQEIADMTGRSIANVKLEFNKFPQYHARFGRRSDLTRILDAWMVDSILTLLGWDFDQEVLNVKLRKAHAAKSGGDTDGSVEGSSTLSTSDSA